MEPDGQTALFSTLNGIIAIDGPVKLQIMEFLYENAQSFDDIVKHTGKAKSTISVHLKDLKASHLLSIVKESFSYQYSRQYKAVFRHRDSTTRQ